MAGQTGQCAPDIISGLLENSRPYSFFQAMRLLRLAGYLPETTEDPETFIRRERNLLIRPQNDLGFPASDITAIRPLPGQTDGLVIDATFLGLYGPASPLPTFYTEDLIQEEAMEETVARDFLDIFNHRLFTLFYYCCEKYRLFFQVCEQDNRAALEKLFCLIGLGVPAHREAMPYAYSLLRYAGLLNQRPRSAWGLETLLSDAFGGMAITVSQCALRMVKIRPDDRMRLGEAGCSLGQDSVIGEDVQDWTGKFRIIAGPVNYPRFHQLLPDNKEHKRMAALINFYLQDPLEFDMELILKEGETTTVRLGGDTTARLGLDTWIFSGPKIGEVRAVFPLSA